MVMGGLLNFFKTSSRAALIEAEKKPITFSPAGTSGTEIYSGYFQEEYLSKLFDEKGIQVFDQMRRSDGQVKMLLSVVKNPIKSAQWAVEPAGEDELDYEISEFVEHCLFKNLGYTNGEKRKTFSEFIEESLTMVEFGHVVFEVVHKMVRGDKEFGDYVGIAELGFRHQRSILEWNLTDTGSIGSIRQNVSGDLGKDVYISGQHLLVMSLEKEGDNYQGISMLRPCYGAWFRKDIYRKLQAIGIERCAKGIPIGTIPADYIGAPDIDAQIDRFQDVIDKLSAHETNGVVLGAGFDVKSLKIEHDAESVQKVIESENIEMSKAFLANFMELGLQGNSGSFSLGTDLSDIFLNGIEYIARMICEKINKQLIETIVKAKYGEQEKYPVLRAHGINDKAGKEFSEIITALVGVDAVQASTRLQRHIHKLYGLPDLDEDIAEKDDERFLNPPSNSLEASNIQMDDKKKMNDTCCKHVHLSEEDREKFPVAAKIEDFAADLSDFMEKMLRQRSKEMLSEMEMIINRGGDTVRDDILAVTMPKSKAYITALREWVGGVVDKAFASTIAEVGLTKKDVQLADKLKKAPKSLRDKLTAYILLTAGYQDSDIEKAVYFSFNENFETLKTENLIKEMENQAAKYFDKGIILTAAVNMASTVVNSTRKETFLMPEVAQEVESFVFRNPDPISPICRALNGKVFSKTEFETSPLTPPLHHNCKSYIEAQTSGKAGNKPITGLKIDGTPDEIEQIMRSKTL